MQTFSHIMLITVITVLTVSFLFGLFYVLLFSRINSLKARGLGNSRKANLTKMLQGVTFIVLILVNILSLVSTFYACRFVTSSLIGWIGASVFTYLCIFVSGLMTATLSLKYFKGVFGYIYE